MIGILVENIEYDISREARTQASFLVLFCLFFLFLGAFAIESKR